MFLSVLLRLRSEPALNIIEGTGHHPTKLFLCVLGVLCGDVSFFNDDLYFLYGVVAGFWALAPKGGRGMG